MALYYCENCKNEILPRFKTGEIKEVVEVSEIGKIKRFLVFYQCWYCIHCKIVYYKETERVELKQLQGLKEIEENGISET